MPSSETEDNTAACRSSSRRMRRRHGSNESKQVEAARLARDLATQGSWSESFLSGSSAHNSTSESEIAATAEEQTIEEIPTMDPPPAYTDNRQQHRMDDTNEADEIEETPESSNEDDVEVPLLNEDAEKGEHPRWQWSPHRHRPMSVLLLMCVLVACVILGSTLGVLLRSQHKVKVYPYYPTDASTIIRKTTEPIHGRFLVQDHLELSTTSGSIDVELSDIKESASNATLLVSTISGDITIRFGDHWRWDRSTRLNTVIRSVMGNVKGRIWLAAGGTAQLITVTGTQDMHVHCQGSAYDKPIELVTESSTGDQKIGILNSSGRQRNITNLHAVHRSLGTANINLQYSHAWTGQLEVISTVGEVDVERDGSLTFDLHESGKVIAHKGDGKKQVQIASNGGGKVHFAGWYTW